VKYLSFDVDERYCPVKDKEGEVVGIVMLRDMRPETTEQFVLNTAASTTGSSQKVEEEVEAEAPEPFIYE